MDKGQTAKIPVNSHRMRGVTEHVERAQYLLTLAQNMKEEKAEFRLMIAAIYSCRAITELMLEAAEMQEVKALDDPDPKKNRNALEEKISPKLPYYALIERIRIHDFHRFGIAPPDRHKSQVRLGGPVKLKPKKGVAAIALAADGPEYITTGNSHIKQQRPLINNNGLFFDDGSSKYVSLEKILDAFLSKVPKVISDFTLYPAITATPETDSAPTP